MTLRAEYTPGPASGAKIKKDGEKWTLVLVRELRAEWLLHLLDGRVPIRARGGGRLSRVRRGVRD